MISELTAAVNGIKAARDAAKLILDVNKQFDQAEFRLQFVEVVGKLSDATDKMVDVKLRVGELEEEIASLRQSLKHRDEMIFDQQKGTFWRKGDDDSLDGPYCPKCWHNNNKPVKMADVPDDTVHQCPACDYYDGQLKRVKAAFSAVPSAF